MRLSQNVPFPLRIYPPLFNKCICATLPEYTPPSQNTLPFSTTKCDLPRIDSTFNNYNIMRCSQNLPLPPRIYPPPYQQLYMTLPESTPPSQNIPTFQQLYYYTTLPESIPPSISPRIYPPPPFEQLYATLTEITPPSENTPPLF